MKKYWIFILPALAAACAAKSGNEAEAFMFKSIPAARANDASPKFLQAAVGSYTNTEGAAFTVSSSGSFELDNISYTVHEVLSEQHAVLKAERPIPGKSQKMITYHGLIIQERELRTAGLKKDLDFSKAPRFSPEDTPYAAILNGQRIENLDFDAAKSTRFGVRIN